MNYKMQVNKKMESLLKDAKVYKSNDKINVFDLLLIMNPKIKNINGCLIVDNEDEISSNIINFQRIINAFGDRTGYEASCNEFRVNDILLGDDNDLNNILILSENIINNWCFKFKVNYPDKKFCIILSVDENNVTIRFHQIWEDESLWIKENIETYSQPIGYTIIGK